MALTQIDFSRYEERKIKEVMEKFQLNKPKAVRKIVRDKKDE